MRKLLPYEHQLIELLGTTKEDYLEFVAVQQEYKDPKAGTALDVRNADGGATAALVLTIVGTLFQVGAALLAPKPEVPDAGGRRRNREQRFAPTFGFNSTQELASYGDPVNLVYTNYDHNENGAVRVAGSLVWSAIENYGSSQFMQLLTVLGASDIKQIDYAKTAFGQTALLDVGENNSFIFSRNGGPPLFSNLEKGKTNLFPKNLKPASNKPACMVVKHDQKKLGFSQAYSPSTATSLGVFDVIPINVDVKSRDKDGKPEEANIAIELNSNQEDNNRWRNKNGTFRKGRNIELFFNNAGGGGGDKQPKKAAEDMRRQMVEALDFGSSYMLGTARFKFTGFVDNTNIDDGEVKAIFECVQAGRVPSTDYDLEDPASGDNSGLREEVESAIEILQDPHTEENVRTDKVIVTHPSSPYVNIKFEGQETVKWYPKITVEIELDGGKTKKVEYPSSTQGTYTFDKAGSIAYTETLKDELNGDKPVLKTKKVKKDVRRQIKALKALVDDIYAGVYDGGDDLPWGNNNYYVGRDPSETILDVNINEVTVRDIHAASGSNFTLHGYDKGIIGLGVDVSNSSNDSVFFSFIYIDRDDKWHFFNFNGIGKDQQKSDEPLVFPNDPRLDTRRTRLANAKDELQAENKKKSDLDKDITTITPDAKDPTSPSNKKELLNKGTALDLVDYTVDIGDIEDKIEKRRKKVNDRIKRNYEKMHKLAVNIIDDDIDYLEAIKEAIPSGNETDRDGTKAVRSKMKELIKQKEAALDELIKIDENWDEYRQSFDNTFFSKCLVKYETASYDTISECNVVKLSLKTKLFRRISGRQKKYGDKKVEEYSASDNGVKSRMVFFRVRYSAEGFSEDLVPYIFAIRRGSEADFYTQLSFFHKTKAKWRFTLEPVYDLTAEWRGNSFTKYAYIDNSDTMQTLTTDNGAVFFWSGKIVNASAARGYYPDEAEHGPTQTNEWDMFSVNSDTQIQFSFESGPEVALTAVTEQQLDDSYGSKYSDMAMMAIGLYAGRGVQDLRNITALVKKGKGCRTVANPDTTDSNSSSYAPDIFVDTVLDRANGIGKYIDKSAIDLNSLDLAHKFCIENHLPTYDTSISAVEMYMDGMIADVGSWREFWINAAPFSLLELARKNGKDTLVPALPVNGSGNAAESNGLPIEVQISALFTAGNILQGSYKEEFLNYGTATEDLIASVIYREYNDEELFSTKRSVEVRLKGKGLNSSEAIRETFDLSQFVTQREQAIMFGKLLCNQRHYIRKGIEFKTFPSQALIEPGAFVYVDVGLKTWDSYSSGIVMENGELNAPLNDQLAAGTYSFLLYDSNAGTVEAKELTVTETGGKNIASGLLSSDVGKMFVMGQEQPRKRVYRIAEVAIEEEGEVSVKAIEYPCFEESGKVRARIADFRNSNFTIKAS